MTQATEQRRTDTTVAVVAPWLGLNDAKRLTADVADRDDLPEPEGRVANLVLALVVSAGRKSVEHLARGVGLDQDCFAIRLREVRRFAWVRRPVAELVMRADMVEMRVRGDGEHVAFGELGNLLAEAHETRARVDEDVPLPPVHEPDVAAVEGNDVRLVDMLDLVVETSHLVPVLRRLDPHPHVLFRSWRAENRNLRTALHQVPYVVGNSVETNAFDDRRKCAEPDAFLDRRKAS